MNQLAWDRFVTMTGAEFPRVIERGLSCTLPTGREFEGFLELSIVLNPDDTYLMTFSQVKNGDTLTLDQYDDIYVEQMHEILTEKLGLSL